MQVLTKIRKLGLRYQENVGTVLQVRMLVVVMHCAILLYCNFGLFKLYALNINFYSLVLLVGSV